MKLSNPEPVLLPWIFHYLGPFKYSVFAARLEEDRLDFPHPWLGGVRGDFRPFPWFELGFSGTFLFGGEGRPGLSFTDLLQIFTFQNAAETGGAKADSLASVDFRFQIPFLRNAELYGEFGAEDTGGLSDFLDIFDDIGFIIGIYFPRVTEDGRLDFRFEFADNAWPYDPTPGYWYSHNIYTSGYTHDQLIMGHHMGPGARDFFSRTTYHLRNDLMVGLDFDLIRRGFHFTFVRETNYQVGTDLTFNLTDNLSLQPRYAYEYVKNFHQITGVDHQNHLFMAVMKWQL